MELDDLIRTLDLQPHPVEGGYFRESYRASEIIPAVVLADRYGGARAFATAIYYLVTPTSFSTLHRLRSDEIFHFYLGDPVEMLLLYPDGHGEVLTLGKELERGMRLQVVVPHGVWQGTRLVPDGQYALLGVTVAPGFEYADLEMADQATMIREYPTFAEGIRRLTVPAS